MKIVFTAPELDWLYNVAHHLSTAAERIEQYNGFLPDMARMRYKFSPNASYVNLKVRERELLRMIAGYRLKSIAPLDQAGSEFQTVQSIQRKLGAE